MNIHKIRRIVYSIEYIHILTFQKEYRAIIAPYFNHPNLEYAIDNENTILESIRLVYPNEFFSFQIRKDSMTFIYEGDSNYVKKSNPMTDCFFEIYNKLKSINGFSKPLRQKILIDSIEIMNKLNLEDEVKNHTKNPFSNLKEFSNILEFEKENAYCTLKIGNYSEKDLTKLNIIQFNNPYNSDLRNNVGIISQISITEGTNNPTLGKFKDILKLAESISNEYNEFNSFKI